MAVLLRDLLADPGLGLIARSSHCETMELPISWVAATELDDPTPFLGGNEIVLTTAIRRRTTSEWSTLARRLIDLPIVGLGLGVGNVHRSTPRSVIAAAQQSGLALFEVPIETPFIKVGHWVAERLYAERYEMVQRAAEAQDQLTRAVLDNHGLPILVRTLGHLNGGIAYVIDQYGSVLASSQKGVQQHLVGGRWPLGAERGFEVSPIVIEGVTIAFLCTKSPTPNVELVSFALNLIGLEIDRRQAILTGQRALLGQVLEDVFQHATSSRESVRRLGIYDISMETANHVIVAQVTCSPERLRRVPWNLRTTLGVPAPKVRTALVDDHIVTVIPAGEDVNGNSQRIAKYLTGLGSDVRVGIGNAHPGVTGLRLSYFEARQALQRGSGIHRCAPLTLISMMMSQMSLLLREGGESTLTPLLRHDAEHGSDLAETLRAYLANNLASGVTAKQLAIHRNTLGYRIEQIERLTHRDLGSLTDQIELWLALQASANGSDL